MSTSRHPDSVLRCDSTQSCRFSWLAGKEYLKYKLLSVDAGGLWVGCQYYMDAFLEGVEHPALLRTPTLFFPYSSISFALDMADYPALSAEGLGLRKWG
jgi:hypothetical protein